MGIIASSTDPRAFPQGQVEAGEVVQRNSKLIHTGEKVRSSLDPHRFRR